MWRNSKWLSGTMANWWLGLSLPVVFLSACTERVAVPDAVHSAEVQALFDGGSLNLFRQGSVDSGTEETFASVRISGVSPDGEHIVVVDRHPPFVRVFHRNGELRAAFLEEGGGPGEALGPGAVAVADTAVLVLDRGSRLLMHDLDGALISEVRSGRMISSVGFAEDTWFLYGPSEAPSEDEQDTWWLRKVSISLDSLIEREHLLRARHRPAGSGAAPPNLTAVGEDLIIYHHWGAPRRVMVVDPESRNEELLDVVQHANAVVPYFRSQDGRVETAGGEVRVTTTPVSPSGLGWIGDGLLWLEREMLGSSIAALRTVTNIWWVRPGKVHRVMVEGNYGLTGITRDGEVLIASDEPVPQVFLVDGQSLAELLSEMPHASW